MCGCVADGAVRRDVDLLPTRHLDILIRLALASSNVFCGRTGGPMLRTKLQYPESHVKSVSDPGGHSLT